MEPEREREGKRGREKEDVYFSQQVKLSLRWSLTKPVGSLN